MGSQGGKGHPGFFRERLDVVSQLSALLLQLRLARQVVFRSDDGILAEARFVVRRGMRSTPSHADSSTWIKFSVRSPQPGNCVTLAHVWAGR